MSIRRTFITAAFVATVALSIALLTPANLALLQRLFHTVKRSATSNLYSTPAATMAKRTPVYFVSHGGPMTMYETEHPVYPRLQALGREITGKVKPKAIVVFSAHWQSDLPDGIQINTSEQEPLLYDFYGFPRHYYMEKFPNRGSPEVAQRVIDVLGEAGIEAGGTDRGLDHGVFVPFKIMFGEDNPVDVPIVQVSLYDDDRQAAKHIQLGRAVEKLRDEGVCIIVSGMAVHNTQHFRMTRGSKVTMPYTVSFDQGLKEAVETKPGEERDQAMVGLLQRPDARQAHPTFEHLLPIHIGVGAAGSDAGKQIWTMPEGSLSWAQYRFGEA